ncbi:hypothetical protein [Hufsiella ginkgonis]|uniref:Uncharacterized protein n=1 Tax=Hufsiella ginkgonis TaxID=2695274 RepID=A0A7K1XTP3_9SPHI|nr:hypothetical protein [Hufsiella ginkgonis]MXV14188.1 hypothetical protein [Hufsiella ginkgonis]
MRKQVVQKAFSIFFIGIFFSKMLISAIPFFLAHYDNKVINAVIMQLEIEDNAEKSSEKMKEPLLKEYCNDLLSFTFVSPLTFMASTPADIQDDEHVQTFYPTVPTPPPNV